MTTMASHKARGFGFETDMLKHLREKGERVERLARTGKDDEGDLVIHHPLTDTWSVLELKAPGKDGKTNLTGWMKEAQKEAANYAKHRGLDPAKVTGFVVIKAFRQPIENAHWVSSIAEEFKP